MQAQSYAIEATLYAVILSVGTPLAFLYYEQEMIGGAAAMRASTEKERQA
jgi:hypothetical protein